MIDPIVEEVRQARGRIAARFGHDLQALFRFLKEQEQTSGREYHNLQAQSEPQSPPTGVVPSKDLPIAT